MDDTVYLQHQLMEKSHWWFKGRFHIVYRILQTINPILQNHMIIDIGCGTGGMISYLSRYYNCIGIDTSKIAVKIASESYPHACFQMSDAKEVLCKLGPKAKVLLLLDVLEHIENDKEFLLNIIEALTPGGYILLTVPANLSLWSKHDESAGHFRRYEPEILKSLWKTCKSIHVCLFSYYNYRLFPIVRIIRYICNKLNISAGYKATDFHKVPSIINALLTSIFSGEANKLVESINKDRQMVYTSGVSLITLLKKS